MNAVVVFESLWGNTAAVAQAIAEGIGHGARAMPTSEARGAVIAEAELIVAGAPLLAFRLPTDAIRESIGSDPSHAANPPDLTHPSMRSWLAALPTGSGSCAAFETRIWWSPGSSAKAIQRALVGAGYRAVAAPQRFVVTGKYGPLKAGELARARTWGETLAQAMRTD
jgi:hypothetical protein